MYLDESGDHNLKRINARYPLFVLGGVIVDRAHVRDVIEPEMRSFKQKFFGRDDVILHTVDMGRGRDEYGFLADPGHRATFYTELNAMLQAWNYLVVACVIDKQAHVATHGASATDPYMYSLDILVECFCSELGDELDSGFVCAERRNPGLDRELMEAWLQLVRGTRGTGTMKSHEIDARIVGFDLHDKKPNLAGMQLADLVITPIGRHINRQPVKDNEIQWSVVEEKLKRVSGSYMGQGLIIRP